MTVLLLAMAWALVVTVVVGGPARHPDPAGLRPPTSRQSGPSALTPRSRTGTTPLRTIRRHRAGARRRREIATAAPDLVDLFAVAIAAGLNVRLATEAVARRAPPGPVGAALRGVEGEVAAGERLADALERVPAATADDETVRSLVRALVDAERYGAALGPTLDRLAAEARRARQRRAEEAARRLPVQLLFPLVTCILPAFGLLTVAPLIAGGLRALRP
ncbi:MAG TPA: type II secretion system F family protein [Acidimicrobiales bacterium]|nr:type II secretion system F family protein [Acidimicrobiales bacterium]